VDAEVERFFGANDSEHRDPDGIKKKECFAQADESPEEHTREDNAGEYGVHKIDIVDPDERVAAQQYIAQAAAADGRDEADEACAEPVGLRLVVGSERAGNSEKAGTEKLQGVLGCHGRSVISGKGIKKERP